MQQQKQQFHIHQQPKRLQDDILSYDVYSESTPISTKNIPTFQKINFNNTKRIADDGQAMCFVQQQNNGSFVAQANIKLTKKSNIIKNGSTQKVIKAAGLNKSQNRENSNASDKLNTSLLKLKSRNRGNENLNIVQVGENIGSQIYPGIMENIKTAKPKIYDQQTIMFSQMTQDSLKNVLIEDDQWKGLNTQKLHKELAAINNSLERQNGFTKEIKLTQMKDFKKTIALANEPLSCQNKLQKDKLMLLKNINQTQKTTTSSQVVTPKYIKFKQKTQNSNVNNQQQTKSNNDQQQKFNEDNSSSNFLIDNSYNISPLENSKQQQFFPGKKSIKNSNQNFQELNNTCNITMDQSSYIFSNEKYQKQRLSEEDREEMSTTINYTTNNDVSVIPNDQFSPNNNLSQNKKNNNVQKLSLQLQNIVIARVNSLKAKRNGNIQRRTEGPSSPNNLVNTSNCNKSFQFIAQNQNHSNGRGGSNGSNPRQLNGINNHQRKNSANQGILKMSQNNQKVSKNVKENTNKKVKMSLADTHHISKKIINNSSQKLYNQKSSQKYSRAYSTKSSRSNSMKKIVKKQKQLKNEDYENNQQELSKIKKETMNKLLNIINFDDTLSSSQLLFQKQNIIHNTIENEYIDTRNQQAPQQHYLYSETFSKVEETAREEIANANYKPQVKEQQVEVHQEIEQMKKELKSKDIVILNLTEKLSILEEQIKSIQSKDTRDKSQQRIKEAIHNLEQKLEQFKFERDQNNQILEEIKFQSSIQSSCRNSGSQKQGHQISQGSVIDDLESLMYYTEREEQIQKSVRTPAFEDMGKCEDVNIIAQGGDIISDGFQDDSCLLMLEKEWQEQQKLLNKANCNNQNNVIYDEDIILEIDDDIRQAALENKEKFIKTQKIEIKGKELVDKKDANEESQEDKQSNGNLPRGESFCRTLSKKNLLAKIRNAIGKDIKKNNLILDGSQRKTPRRFIVKRSQERNQPQQKITIINQQESKPQQLDSSLQQQVTILKCMINQKEKIALNQKEALKKERELSLKLRQTIQKIYLKIQTQQKNAKEN